MARYPKEIIERLREIAPGRTVQEVKEMLNREFPDYTFTKSKVEAMKKNHKIRSGYRTCSKGFDIKYPELLEFVAENVKGRTSEELTEMVNERFNSDFTLQQIRSYKKRHRLTSGLNFEFKPGHVPWIKGKKGLIFPGSEKGWFQEGMQPHNTDEVGTEVVRSDGYTAIKVKEKGKQNERWRFKHVVLWEKHHGPVPEGHKVIFLDGNKENINIENLDLVSTRVHLEMVRNGMRFSDPELTKVSKSIAELNVAIRIKKEEKNEDSV